MEERRFVVKGEHSGNGGISVQAKPGVDHANHFRLENKVAIVTGGASGIGRAIAECFAGAGAQVRILDVDPVSAEKVSGAIQDAGGNASAFDCDVTKPESVRSAFAKIAKKDRIDILVNNAGIAHIGNLETTTPEDFDRLFAVNVKGMFLCMRTGMEYMKERGGVILNMASIAATSGLADRFAYSMTKGAVVSMTYSVAKDYLDYNIRCNCISPARVHTPFVDGFVRKHYPGREQEMMSRLSEAQPVGRMAQPHEVATLALFLCSDEASFITGVDYPIDGGFFKLRG